MAELTPTSTSVCCSTEHQASCCEPQDKEGCCTPRSTSCGCGATLSVLTRPGRIGSLPMPGGPSAPG